MDRDIHLIFTLGINYIRSKDYRRELILDWTTAGDRVFKDVDIREHFRKLNPSGDGDICFRESGKGKLDLNVKWSLIIVV